jgi:phage terminase large subunit-like protein
MRRQPAEKKNVLPLSTMDLIRQFHARMGRDDFLTFLRETLSVDEMLSILYSWEFWARPNQLEPDGRWTIWAILAGRGFGKTRTGAEWVIKRVKEGARRIALVAETAADARDVMVQGEAGILACSPPWFKPTYQPSKRRLIWPNGALAFTYSAEEPDQLRGPAHDTAWCDEMAKWRYQDTWDQLMFGLRLSTNPRACVTTTPRPIKLIRDLVADKNTHSTRGNTYDNRSNLPDSFFDRIIAKYEGTRLGRQEIDAEILEDVPGALWQRDVIDALRRKPDTIATGEEIASMGAERAVARHMRRVTINIDPAATSGEDSDETGITATGIGFDDHGYVISDRSGRYAPNEWATKAIALYKQLDADLIIAESNNGGEMVEHTIHAVDPSVPVKLVHASRGKVTRAEPISALYEQRRVHHIGSLAELEDQMCLFTSDFDRRKAGFSPDRMDSMVWGLTELMVVETDRAVFDYYKKQYADQEDKRTEKVATRDQVIRMRAPAGVSTWYTQSGRKINVGGDGFADVPETDVRTAERAGFRKE